MVHWPLRWVPLQKPSNNLSVYPNLLPSDWGQVEIWNLIRHILGFNLFSLSQVQVKHHISCLPNGFWQPGVRNFSWDSVNKPGFMLEMHKCTLSRMASTHCWRSLSLQIEMQVSLRHFLCFPGIAQSQLLQKISRLARSASTGPPPARGARAGQGRVGTSTVWSLCDCAFAPFRWRWSSFMYLILVKSITSLHWMCLPLSVQETSSCNWQRGRPLVYKSASPRIWKSTAESFKNRNGGNQLHLQFAGNERNASSIIALARRRHRSKPRRGLRKSCKVRMSRLTNDWVPICMHTQTISSRTLSNLTIRSVYLRSEKLFSTFPGQLQLRDFPVKSAARKLVTCQKFEQEWSCLQLCLFGQRHPKF